MERLYKHTNIHTYTHTWRVCVYVFSPRRIADETEKYGYYDRDWHDYDHAKGREVSCRFVLYRQAVDAADADCVRQCSERLEADEGHEKPHEEYVAFNKHVRDRGVDHGRRRRAYAEEEDQQDESVQTSKVVRSPGDRHAVEEREWECTALAAVGLFSTAPATYQVA